MRFISCKETYSISICSMSVSDRIPATMYDTPFSTYANSRWFHSALPFPERGRVYPIQLYLCWRALLAIWLVSLITHRPISHFRFRHVSYNHPLRAPRFVPLPSTSPGPRFDLWTSEAVDVRFPTSLTGDGSDAMYVLDPSMPVYFAVGD